ncbi:unnamed protein product [Phytophthora lilii]|uniref:Unnamed protein product n=1 Tax=Phytophthora lilii TaxID=2077276 RepID=A0A9W6WT90_9STRA|nr:unnamed protein product [Phytophthora lilii]
MFVHKFNEERRKDGGPLWFDLSVDEREQLRSIVPKRARGLTSSVSSKAFARVMTMERARRWVVGNNDSTKDQEDNGENFQSGTSFLSPQSETSTEKSTEKQPVADASNERDSPRLSGSNTSSTEHDADRIEDKLPVPPASCSDKTTSNGVRGSVSKESTSVVLKSSSPKPMYLKMNPDLRPKLKHRDCNILLENMMELQGIKIRRAASKLRSDLEGEIKRSSDMLHSIMSHQFEDPKSNGDVAFVTKVLSMQQQQVRDRFDQFEQKRISDEAALRGLLGQRYTSQE